MLSLTLSIMLVSIIVVFVFSHFYHKYVTLQLKNIRKTVRLFPDEVVKIPFKITGKSIIQLYYGKLSFQTGNVIHIQNARNKLERRETTEFFFDISSGREEYELEISANKRGRAVLRNIELQVFDPLFLGSTGFLYKPFFKTEILVLPKLQSVSGVDALVSNEIGNQPTIYSYYQDPTLISGVRDYTPPDSFQQIHWKATARTGILQTKILEKTTYQKWTFLLNIMEEEKNDRFTFSVSSDLENRLSHLAYLFQRAVGIGATFELFVNILAKNKLQILHLEEGSGNEHCIRGLELLARIDQTSSSVKMEPFLNRVELSLRQSTCIILCGISKQEMVRSVPNHHVHSVPIYELNSAEIGGTLTRC